MRQILHVADLHQGLRTHGRPGPGGVSTAVLRVARAWRLMLEDTLSAHVGVKAVIVAGDAFHGPNPEAPELDGFMAGVRIAREFGVPVVLIAGNHDRAPHPGMASIVDALDDRPYLYGVSRPELILLETGVQVAALPSIGRAQLASKHAGNSRASLEQQVVDGLRALLDGFRASGGADLLTLHYSVQGSVIGAEADISLIPEPMLAPADLDGLGYVAAGHIHKAQVIARGGQIDVDLRALALGAYAGSIDRMNFGEEREAKGAWLADLDEPAGSALWLENPRAQKFLTIGMDDPLPQGPMADDVYGAIIRLRGRSSDLTAMSALRQSLLSSLGAEAVRLEVEPERQLQSRAPEISEAPEPLEALRLWLERREELSPPDRERIRGRAEEL